MLRIFGLVIGTENQLRQREIEAHNRGNAEGYGHIHWRDVAKALQKIGYSKDKSNRIAIPLAHHLPDIARADNSILEPADEII